MPRIIRGIFLSILDAEKVLLNAFFTNASGTKPSPMSWATVAVMSLLFYANGPWKGKNL